MKQIDLNDIYRKYYHQLFLYAVSLTNNEEDAKDLVQDSFIKAVLSYKYFENNDIKFWMLRVIKNQWIDNCRKKKKIVIIDTYDNIEDNYSYNDDFNKIFDNELINNAIDKLPPNYKQLIILAYYNELKYKQIALICNTTESNVKVGIHRAKAMLYEMLKEDFIYE